MQGVVITGAGAPPAAVRCMLLLALLLLPWSARCEPVHDHGQHLLHATERPAWLGEAHRATLINAAFELVDGSNRSVTEQDFHGRYLLIGFGFSHCKFTCPTLLRDWAKMMRLLPESKSRQLRAVMVTLDPERDTPEKFDAFCKGFDRSFIGLSGSTGQIENTANNFRVTYHKVPVDDDYQISHSSVSSLVDPEGRVIDYFGFGTPAEDLAGRIAVHVPGSARPATSQ